MKSDIDLDHTVHAVLDLNAAREAYQRLGFKLMPRATHPSGITANHLIQLQDGFLELIAVLSPNGTPAPSPEPVSFSFASFNDGFLNRRGEGLSMLAISSQDADQDCARCSGAGFPTNAPFRFSRATQHEFLGECSVCFTLGFMHDESCPDFLLFYFQNHTPGTFWQQSYRVHPNTAVRLSGVTIVVDLPEHLRRRVETVFDKASEPSDNGGITVSTKQGVVDVITTTAYENYYGSLPPGLLPQKPWLAGFTVDVTSLSSTKLILDTNSIPYKHIEPRLIRVDPAFTHATTVSFRSVSVRTV